MTKKAGVSVKTIQRALNEIDDLKYVDSGYSGHWEKTGAEDVPHNVPHNVPQDVPQDDTQGDTQDDTQEKIIRMIQTNPKVSTADIAKKLGVGIATVKRKIKNYQMYHM